MVYKELPATEKVSFVETTQINMYKLILVILAAAISCALSDGDVAPESGKWVTNEKSGTAARDKLLDDLLTSYKKYNYPENSTINFGLSILSTDFDLENELMLSNVWLRMSWNDDRFVWDPKERGVDLIRVPKEHVWVPDMTLYNGINPIMECYDSNVLIYPTGKVLWVPPCHLKSYCNLTLHEEPLKEQKCTLKFGSWTFDGLTMGLDFFTPDEKMADVKDYMGGKYKVTTNTAVKEEKYYSCCVEPYFDILYTLGFTKKSQGERECERKE